MTQGFTGQESDGGTAQLDFFNARHLAAVTGAFVQPDPGNAGADVTQPQSWNGYGYVLGNPLDMTDPSGMSYLGPYGNGDPGDPGDPCDGDPWGDGDCGEGPGWWPIGGGRGGRGGTASGSSPSQLPPVNMPASPYPGGERLGLPPGLTVPWPLLPAAGCGFQPCAGAPGSFAGGGGDPAAQIQSLYRNILTHLEKIASDPDNLEAIEHWEVEIRQWSKQIINKAGKRRGDPSKYLIRVIGISASDLENILGTPFILVNPCIINPLAPYCNSKTNDAPI